MECIRFLLVSEENVAFSSVPFESQHALNCLIKDIGTRLCSFFFFLPFRLTSNIPVKGMAQAFK